MFHAFYDNLNASSPAASVIISIGDYVVFWICHDAADKAAAPAKCYRLYRHRYHHRAVLPGLDSGKHHSGHGFLSDIALAFIAFSIGESLQFSTLRKSGGKSLVITLFESIAASVAVFLLTYYIPRLHMAFSIVLSALAAATAPAFTIMTIRQTRAKVILWIRCCK